MVKQQNLTIIKMAWNISKSLLILSTSCLFISVSKEIKGLVSFEFKLKYDCRN